MDDIDIEPPEAPVLSQKADDDIPLPPKKKGFMGLFRKKTKEKPLLPPDFSSMASPTTQAPPKAPQSPPPYASPPQYTQPGKTDQPSPNPPPKNSPPETISLPEPPDPGKEPEEPTELSDTLLPPPKVDEFYDEHMKELEKLKTRLGMKNEIIIPEDKEELEPPPETQETPSKQEIEISIPDEREEMPAAPEKPKSLLKSFFKKNKEDKTDTTVELPTIADLVQTTPKTETSDIDIAPPPFWTSEPSTTEKPEPSIQTPPEQTPSQSSRPGQSGAFADFKKREESLELTKELPPPDTHLPSVTELPPVQKPSTQEEVQDIISSLDPGAFKTFQGTAEEYVQTLEGQLKEIIKRPAKTQLKKPEGKAIDTRLFFRLHKPTDLSSMIKLLKAIEDRNNMDLNTITARSGKDVEKWLRTFIQQEKAKNDTARVKEEIQKILDGSLKTYKTAIEKEKHDLELAYATLLKDKEAVANHTEINKQEQETLKKAKEELNRLKLEQDRIITERVQELSANLRDKEDALKKEREEFELLKKKQDLEIFAEIEKVENIKKKTEAELFDLESDKAELIAENKRFRREHRQTIDTQRKELKEMQKEKKALEKAIISQRKNLEAGQKSYEEKVKKQYFHLSDKLAKEKAEFQKMKDKEMERLTNLRENMQKEKAEINALRNELITQEDRIKNAIEEQKTQIKTDLDEIRKIDMNLEQVEINIRKQKESLEKEGFQRYIQEKLRDVNPAETEHIELSQDLIEQKEIEKALYKDIYEMIDDCKKKADTGKIQEAKVLYNQIRAKYAGSDIRANEKTLLYNQIRELYDDIHLKSIAG